MKRSVIFFICVVCVIFLFSHVVSAEKMQVMLYSSMKDTQLSALKEAFMSKYPNVQMDYYTAGTGKVMTKIAAEKQAGKICTDIIWVGEPTNYITFKEEGDLLAYESPEAATIPSALKDKDNYYCAARIITLGLVYNTNNVKGEDIPKDWADLLNPRFKGLITMTDPVFSGTTLYTVAAFVQNEEFGWEYIQQLKENGIKLQTGSSGVVNAVASGEYDVSIGVNYIAQSVKQQGSPIDFIYPKSGISTVASPIAIMKDSENIEAAKLLYDFILSLDGQKILVDTHVIPVRPEIKMETDISVTEAIERAMPVSDKFLLENQDAIIEQFSNIMKKD
ncbi:ABC transporter substrate-binding protein [bacterium]|nr:ABC transporter substrate-binding protein [bacterium]